MTQELLGTAETPPLPDSDHSPLRTHNQRAAIRKCSDRIHPSRKLLPVANRSCHSRRLGIEKVLLPHDEHPFGRPIRIFDLSTL